MLNFGPQSYWRLNETSGTIAASSVLSNEGTDNGTYNGVVLNEQQSPLAGTTSSIGAAGFKGTSYVQVPGSLADEAGAMSVSLWFNTTATNGVLFSQSADPVTDATTTNPYSPVLYIGSSGKLHGGFAGTGTPLVVLGGQRRELAQRHPDLLRDPGDPVHRRQPGRVHVGDGVRVRRAVHLPRLGVPGRLVPR